MSSSGVRQSEAVTVADTTARPPLAGVGVVVFLALAGLSVLEPLRVISDLASDPLRSVGLMLPPVSLWLACRAWTWRDWDGGGNWWGLALVAAVLVLGVLKGAHVPPAMFLVHGAALEMSLVPVGVLLCAYCSGVVLLFGGTGTWRKAAFPLLLLLLLNPVPRVFQSLVDLPLQSIAAEVTRNFARWLQVPVDGEALQMMFTPRLGIFIAPGCDGMRGATTLGLLALVIGYLYRLPRQRWALFTLCAVLLAYLLNFVRLCGVIVYYWLVLHFPFLEADGAMVDYCIGGCLFFLAVLFLARAPRMGLAR